MIDTALAAPDLSRGGRVIVVGATMIERVPLRAISVPSNFCAMDLTFVAEGVRLLLDNPDADLPPVLLQRATPALHWLVEGRHRYASNLAAGRADILAVVTASIQVA